MKAMLLAAGRGARLRPLTDRLPKPLLIAGEKTLIEHQLCRLKSGGVDEVVINTHYLAEQIELKVGDGRRFGLRIEYSRETAILETGGGIKKALALLGDAPFVVASADTYLDYDFSKLCFPLNPGQVGRLIMVPNPAHHPGGDFSLDSTGLLGLSGRKLTWSGLGVLSPTLVRYETEYAFKLRQVFDREIANGKMDGSLHSGYWCDVGTIDRYEALLDQIKSSPT